MNRYPAGYDVNITFLFQDLNETPVTPTGVSAVLLDENENVVLDLGALPFTLADGQKEVTIPGEFNTLGVNSQSTARILKCTLVTDDGDVVLKSSYIVQGDATLDIMRNSFCSIEGAELISGEFIGLTGWQGASDNEKSIAMISAFYRLIKIPMCLGNDSGNDFFSNSQSHLTDFPFANTIISGNSWRLMSKEDFLELPEWFIKRVRRAQLIEANSILTADPIGDRHRAGIISETIGESSMMLRGGQLNRGVSEDTMRELSGLIWIENRITRV